MNLVLILLPLLGVSIIGLIDSVDTRRIRRVTLCVTGAVFASSFFADRFPLFPQSFHLPSGSLELAYFVLPAGAFFLTVVARGLAGKGESLVSLLLLTFYLGGISAAGRPFALAMAAGLLVSAGTLLRIRGQEKRAHALRGLVAAGALFLGLGVAGIAKPDSPWIFQAAFLCLLGVFPFQFWLPRVLGESPFLFGSVGAVLVTRFAIVIYLRFAPERPEPLIAVLALLGIVWCGFAAFGADDLRERLGYMSQVHTALAVWAASHGAREAALMLLLLTTAPAVLWGLASSVLFDRLKYLSLERITGLGPQLPRLTLVFLLAAAGMAFFPGSCAFSGFSVLLESARAAPRAWLVCTVAAFTLLLAAGQAYVAIAFGEGGEDVRRSGDLNRRELLGAVPLAVCVAAGLWPGFGAFLVSLLG